MDNQLISAIIYTKKGCDNLKGVRHQNNGKGIRI